MDEELENAIQNVDLEGDEILNLLNKNLPPKINKIFDEIINERKKIIREKNKDLILIRISEISY